MTDHWEFVLAAYGLTALALGAYWRRLHRQEQALAVTRPPGAPPRREGARAEPADPPPGPPARADAAAPGRRGAASGAGTAS